MIQLRGHHFHNKRSEGVGYVRDTLIKNLREAKIKLVDKDGKPEELTLKELGIGYPAIVSTSGRIFDDEIRQSQLRSAKATPEGNDQPKMISLKRFDFVSAVRLAAHAAQQADRIATAEGRRATSPVAGRRPGGRTINMDQVKVILKILQKHHFWLLCVVTMIAGVTGWFMARKSLSADFEKNKGSILGKFTALQGILSTENHPNGTWTTGIGELTKKEKGYRSRRLGHGLQRAEKAPGVAAGARRAILEVHQEPPAGRGDSSRSSQLDTRTPSCSSEFPRLVAIVDARLTTRRRPVARLVQEGWGSAAPAAHEYKVTWDSTNQQDVEKMLDFPNVPSSAEVRQAQEDIWIYKALLNIIKNMNEGTYFARGAADLRDFDRAQGRRPSFKPAWAGSHIEKLKSAAAASAERRGRQRPRLPAGGRSSGQADRRESLCRSRRQAAAQRRGGLAAVQADADRHAAHDRSTRNQ